MDIVIGGVYKHFKGNLYRVRHVGTHTETGERMVVYQKWPHGDNIWISPYESFVSEVDREKYPDATQDYRFELVEYA